MRADSRRSGLPPRSPPVPRVRSGVRTWCKYSWRRSHPNRSPPTSTPPRRIPRHPLERASARVGAPATAACARAIVAARPRTHARPLTITSSWSRPRAPTPPLARGCATLDAHRADSPAPRAPMPDDRQPSLEEGDSESPLRAPPHVELSRTRPPSARERSSRASPACREARSRASTTLARGHVRGDARVSAAPHPAEQPEGVEPLKRQKRAVTDHHAPSPSSVVQQITRQRQRQRCSSPRPTAWRPSGATRCGA